MTTMGDDPDEAPKLPEIPVSQVGDLWILGAHRLLCGDSTNASDVARCLGSVAPHLLVSDPPYGVNYDPTWRTKFADDPEGLATGTVLNDDRADWREAWRSPTAAPSPPDSSTGPSPAMPRSTATARRTS